MYYEDFNSFHEAGLGSAREVEDYAAIGDDVGTLQC
jgi:hypothetical protein